MSQVFISYSHEDSKFAQVLRSKLETAGFAVWMDTKLRGGTRWREEIDGEIRRSFALCVIMTTAAKGSDYVTYEWAFAYGARVRVIPLILNLDPADLHPRLKLLQYRDFRDEGHQPWDELMKDMREAQSSQLTVHCAIWAARDRMRNVTDKVSDQVSAGKLDLVVQEPILPDAAQGDPKKLVVVYSCSGEDVSFEEVDEDGRLVLPK